jgi:hypothetical protein
MILICLANQLDLLSLPWPGVKQVCKLSLFLCVAVWVLHFLEHFLSGQFGERPFSTVVNQCYLSTLPTQSFGYISELEKNAECMRFVPTTSLQGRRFTN